MIYVTSWIELHRFDCHATRTARAYLPDPSVPASPRIVSVSRCRATTFGSAFANSAAAFLGRDRATRDEGTDGEELVHALCRPGRAGDDAGDDRSWYPSLFRGRAVPPAGLGRRAGSGVGATQRTRPRFSSSILSSCSATSRSSISSLPIGH